MKNVLISGGAGFIGSNLAKVLLERNYNVTIFDNFSPQIHGENPDMHFLPGCHVIKGDVRNIEDWGKALKDINYVFHFAAETGTGQSMYEITKYNMVNVIGTTNLLDLLVTGKHGIEKVILASSRAIYGEGKYYCKEHNDVYPGARNDNDLIKKDFDVKCPICGRPVVEVPTDEYSKPNPLSVYAITKLTQENLIMQTCNALNVPAVALRFQNVYGPGQSLKNPYTGILSIFSTRFLNNKDVYIFEDGKESRDFVYIDDVVKANILALEKDVANGKIYNVGSGKKTTVMEVAAKLKELYNSKSKIIITGEVRKGDIRHNFADISKIRKELNFNPDFSFEKGLKLFVKWVLTQNIEADNYEKSLLELKEKGLLS